MSSFAYITSTSVSLQAKWLIVSQLLPDATPHMDYIKKIFGTTVYYGKMYDYMVTGKANLECPIFIYEHCQNHNILCFE